MRSMTLIGSLICLVLLAGPAAAPQDTEATAKVSFATLLPEDTWLFASFRDLETLRNRLDAAGLKEILENEEIKKFIEYLETKAEGEGEDEEGNKFPISFAQILETVEGEVAFALGEVDFESMIEDQDFAFPDQVIVLINAKTKADAFAKLVDEAVEHAVDKGMRKEEEAYKGVTITTLIGEDDQPMSVTRTGSIWALTPGADAVKPLIKRLKEGSENSLADNDLFRTVQREVGRDADAIFYLNVKPIVEALNDAFEDGDGMMGPATMVRMMIKLYGLEDMEAIGAGLTVGADKIDMVGYAHAPKLSGMIEALFPKGDNPKMPDYVADDVHMASTSLFNVESFWESYLEMMGDMLEDLGMSVEDMIDQFEAMLGIDIQEDLIEQVGSPMIMTAKFPKGEAAQMLLAMPANDGDTLDESIQSIIDAVSTMPGGGDGVDEEEYLDATLYTFAETMEITIKNDTFLFGIGDVVKPAMRRMGKSESRLTDLDAYKEIVRLLPEKYTAMTYMSAEGMARYIESILDGTMFEAFGDMPAEPFGDQLDPEEIPDPRILTRHIKGLISWNERTDSGVKTTTRLPLKK